MRSRNLLAILGIAGAAVVAGPAVAQAQLPPQNVVCVGTIGPIAVDNVEVPEFATCLLDGTQVLGSVEVKPQSRLTARSVTVAGNIAATEARSAVVSQSRVTGDIAIVQGGVARVTGSTVGGSILVDGQSGAVNVSNNRIGTGVAGNIEIFANVGGTTISRNRVAGNLACKDNLPAPIGGLNVVGGNKEDQCLLL